MKLELDQLLKEVPEMTEVIYLEVALHCFFQKMKEIIKEQIHAIQEKVDVIFLGYGYCQALKGIEDEFEIPIVMP
jgi:PII-like signaling protein